MMKLLLILITYVFLLTSTVTCNQITIAAGTIYTTQICTNCVDSEFGYTLKSLDQSVLNSCFYKTNGNGTCYPQLSCFDVIYCSRPNIQLDNAAYSLAITSTNIFLPATVELNLSMITESSKIAAGIVVLIIIACLISFICLPCILYRRYRNRRKVYETNVNYINLIPTNTADNPLALAIGV